MRRTTAVVLATGFLTLAGSTGPAVAAPVPEGALGGFATTATATPIKIEIYEPAIPVPSEPQGEIDVMYTKVQGTSGPAGSGRASALWPGDPVGEGFKTIGETVGLPPQLTDNGYPVQTNASSPGDPSSSAQEPFPGVITRVVATPESTVAKAGFNPAGDTDSQPSGGSSPAPPSSPIPLPGASNPLSGLTSALGGGSAPTTSRTSVAADAPQPSPLGALAALIDAGTTSSVSRTTYVGETVSSDARSALHDIKIAGGVITIKSVAVVAHTEASLAGSKSTAGIKYAGLEIAGTPFSFDKDGAVAGGQKTPIPGLPDDPADALKALGIQISLPKPTEVREGVHGAMDARGIRVTIDTGVLRSKLPSLPVDQITKGFPDSAKQLKGLLLALNEAHPKFVVYLGTAMTDATAVPPVSFGASTQQQTQAPGSTPAATAPTGGTSSGGGASTGGAPGSGTAAAGGTATSTAIKNVSATPGLPPLGSVPGALMLGGILLGSAAGWWIRKGGSLVLGGASSCAHGLASGVPDLRKA